MMEAKKKSWIFSTFENASNRVAIQQSGKEIRYSDLICVVDQWVSSMREQGLREGHSVALVCGNRATFLIIMLACLETGVTFVPVDPALTSAEIAAVINRISPTWIVYESSVPAEKVAAFFGSSSVMCLDAMGVRLKGDLISAVSISGNPEFKNIAVVQFSSGSTGVPKGILVSAHALEARVKNLTQALGLTQADITLCSVPLSHSHGMDCLALPTLWAGGKLILREPSTATPPAVLEQIESDGVTFFSSIPLFYQMAIKLSSSKKYDLKSWRLPFCGSAALSGETAREFEKKFGVQIRQGYGLAEIGVITIYSHDSKRMGDKPVYESIGSPIPGIYHRLDQNGQLIVRGEALMTCYFEDPAMTEERMPGGELHTQDLIQISEESGLFFVVGRLNESIHVAAQKVYPIEIEREVSLFPEVAYCAVVGEKNQIKGEVPVLHIELRGGIRVDDLEDLTEEMIRRLRKKLSDFKIPSRVQIHSELPKSPLGKVLRAKLKES